MQEERVRRQGRAVMSGEKRDMAATQERAIKDALLPKTAEGLRFIMCQSMYHLPPWMPDFMLHDIIRVVLGLFHWVPFLALQSSDTFMTMLLLLSKYRMKSLPVVDISDGLHWFEEW
jgi:hypothetical protein